MWMDSAQKRKKNALIAGACALALFLLLALLLLTVDRAAIGPEGSIVGLSALNGAVAKALPFRGHFKRLSDIGGALLLLEGLFFAFLALCELIRGKKFSAVPIRYYLLGALYIVTIGIYAVATVGAVNFRPVILPSEGLEPSFPSSHVLLAAVIGGSAVPMLRKLFSGKPRARLCALTANACLCLFTVFCRILSGVHWITDSLGALLLGFALVAAFLFALEKFPDKKEI